MPEDLPVVPSLDDLKSVQAEIEALKVRVAALEAEMETLITVTMPDDVKAAFNTFMEWVKANV
jgi:hypothetical protein